jgi:uncharacterized protein (TIGR04141 family)
MPAKTNKLSIYLIRPEFQRSEDVLECTELPIQIPGVGEFYFERSHPNPPSWLSDFFGNSLTGNLNILFSSARGILLVPLRQGTDQQFVAVSFGVGRHLLKESVYEERFGLKVVLNSVDPTSFRSIAKTSLGSVPKHSQEQMSKNVTPAEFGIDIEQDLVGSVTGFSRDSRLGKLITGKDALNVSVKIDVATIVDFLSHCVERYRSDDYKQNFDWIDQISDVRDTRKEQSLNEELINRLNSGNFDKIWMAVPEVIDWSDVKGFRYGKPKRGDLHDDLEVPAFITTLNGVPITLEILKGQNVFLIGASSDDVASKWSTYRCLYAELPVAGELFVLNNGKWYSIASGFQSQVQSDFASMAASSLALPDCTVNDEGVYNLQASQALAGSCCMDCQTISYGGGHSKIEFCDLLTSDKKMVHVKRYGGSSVLSHLFAQGVVSGELFVSDADFRQKLNAKLPNAHKFPDPSLRPMANQYEIVYAIISESGNPLDIPFFSKVSLRNSKRRLTSFGYNVALQKILKV